MGMDQMRIAISGANGFIGTRLSGSFPGEDVEVVPLKHTYFRDVSDDRLLDALQGVDVIINLAGVSINRRWDSAAKREILDSRILTTRRLVSLINAMPRKPSLFISASAVGIYPATGIYSENSASEGTGFLSEVCRRWEEEAQKVSTDVRLAITRFGVVLDKSDGALPKMLLPFRFFVGGKIGSGEQGFSWIHIEDLARAMWFVITHEELSGIINFVAPQPIINRVFTRTVSEVMHRPAWFTVPDFVFHLLYGEGAVLVTEGQQVYPARLISAGYVFRYPDIRIALRNILA